SGPPPTVRTVIVNPAFSSAVDGGCGPGPVAGGSRRPGFPSAEGAKPATGSCTTAQQPCKPWEDCAITHSQQLEVTMMVDQTAQLPERRSPSRRADPGAASRSLRRDDRRRGDPRPGEARPPAGVSRSLGKRLGRDPGGNAAMPASSTTSAHPARWKSNKKTIRMPHAG